MDERLLELLSQLVERMSLTNQFLAQVVANNADMLDAGGETKDDGPETLTNRVGSVGKT